MTEDNKASVYEKILAKPRVKFHFVERAKKICEFYRKLDENNMRHLLYRRARAARNKPQATVEQKMDVTIVDRATGKIIKYSKSVKTSGDFTG